MASLCERQQCSIERRGFRQELDSWRHKLIHCVGFESILEGLFGPGLVEDLTLFKDCEPTAVSDWSFDENCLFCCLRREKVKEHLIGLNDRVFEEGDRAHCKQEQSKINRLEKQAEEFLNAVLYRKEVPSFSDPHIPRVAREIMQRMIRQFAAEYTSKSSSSQDSLQPNGAQDQSPPVAPSPAASAQNPVLSKLLMADQDSPLDLTVKKPEAEPSEQDGVLDLSTKKSHTTGSTSLRAAHGCPATPVKGDSLDRSLEKVRDLQSTSTLEQFMAKLCLHHQRQIVDALGFLQTEVQAVAASCCPEQLAPESPVETDCSPVLQRESADFPHTGQRAVAAATSRSIISASLETVGLLNASLSVPQLTPEHAGATDRVDEEVCSSRARSNPLDLRKAGPADARGSRCLFSDAGERGSAWQGNLLSPTKRRMQSSGALAEVKKLRMLETSRRQCSPETPNRKESRLEEFSPSIGRHDQLLDHLYHTEHRSASSRTKDLLVRPYPVKKASKTTSPVSPRTARKSGRGPYSHHRDSVCQIINDPDSHCDIVYISKPITECEFQPPNRIFPRRNARKSTRGHAYIEECCELKTVRTLARKPGTSGKGTCPAPVLENSSSVTPKPVLSKPESVPPVDTPIAGGCGGTFGRKAISEELMAKESGGDDVAVVRDSDPITVETSQTGQPPFREHKPPCAQEQNPEMEGEGQPQEEGEKLQAEVQAGKDEEDGCGDQPEIEVGMIVQPEDDSSDPAAAAAGEEAGDEAGESLIVSENEVKDCPGEHPSRSRPATPMPVAEDLVESESIGASSELEKRDLPLEKQDSPLEKQDPPLEKQDSPLEKQDSPLEKQDPPLDKQDPSLEKQDPPLEKQDPLLEKQDQILEKQYQLLEKKDPHLELPLAEDWESTKVQESSVHVEIQTFTKGGEHVEKENIKEQEMASIDPVSKETDNDTLPEESTRDAASGKVGKESSSAMDPQLEHAEYEGSRGEVALIPPEVTVLKRARDIAPSDRCLRRRPNSSEPAKPSSTNQETPKLPPGQSSSVDQLKNSGSTRSHRSLRGKQPIVCTSSSPVVPQSTDEPADEPQPSSEAKPSTGPVVDNMVQTRHKAMLAKQLENDGASQGSKATSALTAGPSAEVDGLKVPNRPAHPTEKLPTTSVEKEIPVDSKGSIRSTLDKCRKMPLTRERSSGGVSTRPMSSATLMKHKKVVLRSQRSATLLAAGAKEEGGQNRVDCGVKARVEKSSQPQKRDLDLFGVQKLDLSAQNPPKFLEALRGEENQLQIASLNSRYDKMQRGWVQLDKEGQPAPRPRNKADRLKDIWKSKRRIRKPRPLDQQRYSPVQMLFMKTFDLTSICRWFLQTTETKSLVIVKKVNTRLPSETQLCFHSSSGAVGSSHGVFPSLQAERLKKHLKKFAVASPVKSNAKSQKLIAKAWEQDGLCSKGKEKVKELTSATRISTKPYSHPCKPQAQAVEIQKAVAVAKSPASARILRKYSNIREKLHVQQHALRPKETDSKSVSVKPSVSPKLVSKPKASTEQGRKIAPGERNSAKEPPTGRNVKADSPSSRKRDALKKAVVKQRGTQNSGGGRRSLKILSKKDQKLLKRAPPSSRPRKAPARSPAASRLKHRAVVPTRASRLTGVRKAGLAKAVRAKAVPRKAAVSKGRLKAPPRGKALESTAVPLQRADAQPPPPQDQVLTRSQRRIEATPSTSGASKPAAKRTQEPTPTLAKRTRMSLLK